MRCPWVWSDFGQPVYWSSGLCSCVAGEFVWYVLLWNLLARRWCLVSVQVWRGLMSSYRLMFLDSGILWCSQDLDLRLLLLVFSLIFTVASRLLHVYSTVDKTSPFEDNGLLLWVPDVLCRHSEVVLWNWLSVQMFFWWICGGARSLPVLFLCHLRTAPSKNFKAMKSSGLN